jgi:hypothetical protein
MSQGSIGAGSTRHRAFFIWAAILSLVFALLFIHRAGHSSSSEEA